MFFVARLIEHNSHIEDLCEATRWHDDNRPKSAASRRSRASMIRNIPQFEQTTWEGTAIRLQGGVTCESTHHFRCS